MAWGEDYLLNLYFYHFYIFLSFSIKNSYLFLCLPKKNTNLPNGFQVTYELSETARFKASKTDSNHGLAQSDFLGWCIMV